MVSSMEKILFTKLKGNSNYKVWSLRTEAFLIKEKLNTLIISLESTTLDENINHSSKYQASSR